MKFERKIYDLIGLQTFFGECRKLFNASGFLKVTVGDEKPRSLSQNAISWAWYGQVARELGEDTAEGVHQECKLRFGVPLMRTEDEEFAEFCEIALDPLTWDQQLKAMAYVPVTSIMTTAQLSRYLEAMRLDYKGRVDLQFPPGYA